MPRILVTTEPISKPDLGVMLAAQGDLDGATAAFRRADERGDARGSFNLGILLGESGDQAGADAALRRASERGSPDVAELAREALRDLAAGASSGGNPEKGGATHWASMTAAYDALDAATKQRLDGLHALHRSWWSGITPDGSPIFSRDISTDEIYALDLKLP